MTTTTTPRLAMALLVLAMALLACGREPQPTGATVLGVRLAADRAHLPVGVAGRVSVIATLGDGSVLDVSAEAVFATSDPAVAEVSADLTLHAVGVGGATLQAEYQGLSAGLPVEVTAAELLSVRLAPPGAAMTRGGQASFAALGHFTDGAERDVSDQVAWESDDDAVADVSAGPGLATAAGVGVTQVRAVHAATGLAAAAAVSVSPARLASIAFTDAAVELDRTGAPTHQLTLVGTSSDGTRADLTALASWFAGGEGVVTLQAGFLTASGAGDVQVFASIPGESIAPATIAVHVR